MRIRLIQFILTLFPIIIIYFPASAQENTTPDSSLQIILNNLEGDELSLADAINYALNNAVSVRRAEAAFLAASGSLRRERGYFDPEFFFYLNHRDLEEPAASFFAGADVLITEQTTSQTGLKLRLPFGTELEAGLNTVRLKTNSQFAFLNPEYDAFGSLSFRQPLLKGFSLSGRKHLTHTEFLYEAAKALYDQEVIAVASVAEQLYWNLYTSERDYAVQTLTLDRAKSFLNETELRYQAGLVGPNQTANARTFLAEQTLLLIDRDEQLETQSDQLAAFLGVRPENTRFKTVDNPPHLFPVESVEDVLEKALNNNLELAAARSQVDAANSLVDASAWEYLPSVDLFGSLVSTGIGGEPRNVIFGADTLRSSTSGSFGDVLNQVFKSQYPGWSIGIELRMPIGLRPGLGERDRVEAEALSVSQRYTELSRILEQHIRKAHRELSHGNDRLKAAADGVEAAGEQVRIGMIEFQNGRITAFELVRLNEDFALAQRRYSEALVRTVNAAASLRQLTSSRN